MTYLDMVTWSCFATIQCWGKLFAIRKFPPKTHKLAFLLRDLISCEKFSALVVSAISIPLEAQDTGVHPMFLSNLSIFYQKK